MTDIDLTLPVFLYQDGESVVKGKQVLSDRRRIILFTTKEHLKILARARQILGDGTFRRKKVTSARRKKVTSACSVS